MDMPCPCSSNKNYSECCGPFIAAEKYPSTAEEVMRSRYTAYAVNEMDHLVRTQAKSEEDFDRDIAEAWALESEWLGLDVLKTDCPKDKPHTVEFIAKYHDHEGKFQAHHEVAYFENKNNKWIYTHGDIIPKQTIARGAPKLGRNDPCSCGSGKKFKKCCGA